VKNNTFGFLRFSAKAECGSEEAAKPARLAASRSRRAVDEVFTIHSSAFGGDI